MIRLFEISPMPIGLTPGFLSRAIKWQFKRGCKASGSVKEVEIRFATRANEWQRSEEAVRKEVHKRLQPRVSTPKGPADP